jgi:hypothetical protein
MVIRRARIVASPGAANGGMAGVKKPVPCLTRGTGTSEANGGVRLCLIRETADSGDTGATKGCPR